MPDLLVKLYDLPASVPAVGDLSGVTTRRAFSAERRLITRWVESKFGDGWASECEASFARSPVACLVSVEAGRLLGFACYDATARGVFGPVGVDTDSRKRGVGSALLLATLQDMSTQGYAYAIIGGAGTVEFYRKTVGAIEVPGSTPGFYRGMLRVR